MSIQIRNIRKSFGENEVLKGIDFDFETSKINMIIGASGSGKSVLIKCMLGLMRPDDGAVTFDGMDVLSANRKELRELRKNIGVLFQSSALFDSMTVYQNVAFPMRMFTDMSKAEIEARVAECLDKVNLPGVESLLPAELSGGMRKRVGLARAIALNPHYLICDEPNSGLDPKTADVIDQLIADITHEFKTTTIVITHDMKSVLNHADKVMFLYKGQKEWEGARTDIPEAESEPLLDFIDTSGLMNSELMKNAMREARAEH